MIINCYIAALIQNPDDDSFRATLASKSDPNLVVQIMLEKTEATKAYVGRAVDLELTFV